MHVIRCKKINIIKERTMKKILAQLTAITSFIISSTVFAGDLTIPNTFNAGTRAVASEVNANFNAVETAVDDNDFRITTNSANIDINSTDITTNAADIVAIPRQIIINVKEVSGNIWRGWYIDSGQHTSSNDNTITGDYTGGSNSYFVFDVSTLAGTIQRVVLELELEYFSSTDATEIFSVYDVSTDSATLEADSTVDTAIYNDLMTGSKYGGHMIMASDVGSVLHIPIRAQAVIDLQNALGGDFSVGVHSETEPPGAFRFSSSSEARVHRLIITYIP